MTPNSLYRVTGSANFTFYNAKNNVTSSSNNERVDELVSAPDPDTAQVTAKFQHLGSRSGTVIRLEWCPGSPMVSDYLETTIKAYEASGLFTGAAE